MPQSHYINKLKFTVAAPHSADVFALQSAVSQRIKQSVVPAVSVVFDRFADVDEVIKIDRLDIDLTHIPFSRWETEITPSVCRAIEAELARILLDVPTIAHILKGIKVAKQSVVQSQFEAWLYFLETGQLPKTASFEAGWRHAALDSVAANIRDVEILRGLLLRKSVVVERLVLQHDEPFLLTLAEAMTGRNQSELRSFRQTFEAVLTADTFIRELKKLATSSIEFTSLAARDIEILFWKKVFEDLANGSQMIDFQLFISRFLGLYLQQILKKDYVLFLKSIVFWAKPKRQKIKKAKDTPSVSEVSESVFSKKEKQKKIETAQESEIEKLMTQSLNLVPQFTQFLNQKATDSAMAKALIHFFEQEIKVHAVAIRQLQIAALADENQAFFIEKKEQKMSRDMVENMPKKAIEKQAETVSDRASESEISEDVLNHKKMPFDKEIIDFYSKNDPKQVSDAPMEMKNELAKQGDFLMEQAQILEESTAQLDDEQVDGADAIDKDLPTMTNLIAPHAGLVLLHPFLNSFFESIGLLRGGKFENKKAQRRAAAILHYLATGETEMAEYDMAIPKLLVGLPLAKPIDRRIILTDLERSEADDLLAAVIKHWKALGNTSPDGLREGFLKRYGKVTKRSDGLLLIVEAKTLDILLDRLPWGFSIIRLQWMNEMLFVEWH